MADEGHPEVVEVGDRDLSGLAAVAPARSVHQFDGQVVGVDQQPVAVAGFARDQHELATSIGVVGPRAGKGGFDDGPLEIVQRLGRPQHHPDSPDGAALCKQPLRSEEHTSELQSLMRISSAVFCLKKKKNKYKDTIKN